jgi:hypothetical protein
VTQAGLELAASFLKVNSSLQCYITILAIYMVRSFKMFLMSEQPCSNSEVAFTKTSKNK